MPDEILEYIKASVDRIEANQERHDGRLRSLEAWQSNANGKMTTLSVFCMAFGGLATAIITYLKR